VRFTPICQRNAKTAKEIHHSPEQFRSQCEHRATRSARSRDPSSNADLGCIDIERAGGRTSAMGAVD